MSRGLVTAAVVPARWSRIDARRVDAIARITDSQMCLTVAAKQPQTLNFFHIARSMPLAQSAQGNHPYLCADKFAASSRAVMVQPAQNATYDGHPSPSKPDSALKRRPAAFRQAGQ